MYCAGLREGRQQPRPARRRRDVLKRPAAIPSFWSHAMESIVRLIKNLRLLSPFALAGALLASPVAAFAMPTAQGIDLRAPGTSAPADYSYQGHHYYYHYNGHYYNHRTYKHDHWSYY